MAENPNPFEFPGADTKIEVNYKGKKVIGKVSGDALSRASPVWKNFVTPPWQKNDTSDFKSDRPPIDFLEDDTQALLLLLNIAHLQFRRVPDELGYFELYQIAILSDQYQCVELLYPWIGRWFANEELESKKDGQEGWLFIAWVFGRDDTFKALTSRLVLNAQKDTDGSLLLAHAYKLPEIMPIGIIGMQICIVSLVQILIETSYRKHN